MHDLVGAPRSILRWSATLSLGLALLSGCARYQYVNVRSEPAGAEVFVDGERVGRTPLRIQVDRDTDHLVFLKLEGHLPERRVLTLNRVPDRIDFLTPADVETALGRTAASAQGTDSRGLEIQLEEE